MLSLTQQNQRVLSWKHLLVSCCGLQLLVGEEKGSVSINQSIKLTLKRYVIIPYGESEVYACLSTCPS